MSVHNNQYVQVMLVERSLDGSRGADNDSRFTWSDDTSLAEGFLSDHNSAKILVAIDTHSADNSVRATLPLTLLVS